MSKYFIIYFLLKLVVMLQKSDKYKIFFEYKEYGEKVGNIVE